MIEISTKKSGAELTSIKLDGIERLHDGKEYWNRHAPILFPIVGQLKNGESVINGNVYKMSQHGFARDMEFEEIGNNSFKLSWNEQTLEKYPYKFELYVSYEIDGNRLYTQYRVKNVDNKAILFGLGGHPAFKCDYKNAEIEFEKDEDEVQIYQLENGLIKTEPEEKERFIDNNIIKLNENYFDNDAVIFKKLKSNRLILKEKGKPILKFDFSDFPFLGIWSKKDANFICIEPWFNTTDSADSDGVFEHKDHILSLETGEEFSCKFFVEFI